MDDTNSRTAGATAVVTGAASGIGAALARALAERGLGVRLCDVDADGLARVAGELGSAVSDVVDVSEPDAMVELARVVGPVDVLCLNAGVLSTDMGAPWEASPQEWQRVLGVNLLGVVNGLRAFVPSMVERGAPASILVTASLAGAATWPGGGPYAASKHAVLAVAEQAALTLADTPVSVTVTCPALVRSAMSPEGADPADVASEALAAVDAGDFAVIPPEWRHSVVTRGEHLAAGRPPTLPAPG